MRQIERKILAKEREARSCERDGGKIGKISRPMSRLVSFTGGDWHSRGIWELHGFCAKPVDLITSAFQLTSQAWVCKFFKPCSAWDFFWNNISSHILSSFAFGLYCNWWWSMRLAITCEFCWGWSSSRSWYEPAPLRSRSPSQVSKTWSGWHQESLGLDQDDQDHLDLDLDLTRITLPRRRDFLRSFPERGSVQWTAMSCTLDKEQLKIKHI